jgi:hypothetical protein
MPPLGSEWTFWALMNGLPALIATIAFLLYPPFDNFAWNVQDRRSGIFLGTGFLMRTALFVQVITAKSWGEIRWLTYGNAVFAAVLLGVTLIWGDIFQWRRWIAIIWLYLYIEEPLWMITLVPQAQAAAGNAIVAGGQVLLLTQIVLGIEAVVMLVAGLYLWFVPQIENVRWFPWKPDLVSARIMAGFPLGWVAWSLTLAAAPSWAEARGGVQVNLVWLIGMLFIMLVFRARFDLSKRPTQIYAGFLTALIIAIGLVYFIQGM